MNTPIVIGDAELWLGDCMEVLPTLAAESVDAVVTDPPAGISFMGKEWDHDKGGRKQWIAWMTQIAAECLRVLKPGGHAFVWSLPRTSHWTATAWEDAGFEPRDCVYHIFSTGFPKSLDISKAIDKAAGAEREVVGVREDFAARACKNHFEQFTSINPSDKGINSEEFQKHMGEITAPATPAARQWDGWGSALKPAAECWWLFRKPLSEKTIAANVLRWGCGGINVDGGRIESGGTHGSASCSGLGSGKPASGVPFVGGIISPPHPLGRFPSNVIFDEAAGAMLPNTASSGRHGESGSGKPTGLFGMGSTRQETYYDTGSAARYFYCAKSSRSEREAGLEDGQKASHPTVKPLALMRYLCRLITPPGGVILDPFLGSGSTGCAAALEGFAFVGIEREPEYLAIAEKRVAYWQSKAAMPLFEAEPLADPDPASPAPDKPRLF